MGYFSNGSEGECYRERYCEQCLNNRDLDDGRGPGCPVWDAHLSFNYDATKDKTAEIILSMLIPREGIGNGQCKMFLERPQ